MPNDVSRAELLDAAVEELVPDGSVAERRLARRAVAAIACRVRRRHRLGKNGPTREELRKRIEDIADAAVSLSALLRRNEIAHAFEDAWASRDADDDARAVYSALDQLLELRQSLPARLAKLNVASRAAIGKLGLAGRAGSRDPWETFQVPAKTLVVYLTQRLFRIFRGTKRLPTKDRNFVTLTGQIWEIATGEPGEQHWRRQIANANLKRPLTFDEAVALTAANFASGEFLFETAQRLHAIRRNRAD
jgi:hypothetical protein